MDSARTGDRGLLPRLTLHVLLLCAAASLMRGGHGGQPPPALPSSPQGDMAATLVVRSRVIAALTPSQPLPALDHELDALLLPTLNVTGMWPDVQYDAGGRSWWGAAEHLRRTLLLASAFNSPHSSHHLSQRVLAAATAAFHWWLRTDPQNSNWWWMQFGVPRIVCKILLLLPEQRAQPLLPLAEPLLARTPESLAAHWAGCNRVWFATIHVLRGAIERNSTRLGFAFPVARSTIVLSPLTSDGFQTDGSFHQHGSGTRRELYSGWGYGAIFTTNVLVLESYASGTAFAMSNSTWETFAHFVLDGQVRKTPFLCAIFMLETIVLPR